jgi:glutamate formiminotransferase
VITPTLTVLERIRAEAAQRGVSVAKSEIVGLTPRQALLDTALAALQLHRFDSRQILEQRINDQSADT